MSGFSPSCLPSLRTLVGYLLRTWHQMICSGRKVRPTDHYDFRIAVQAGTVGRVLTGDRQLRNILNKIPSLSMRVWTLNEFVSRLPGKSN
jgi:ribosomal protein S3AE